MERLWICGFVLALGACARGDDAKPAVAATFGPSVGDAGTTEGTGVTPVASTAAEPDTDTDGSVEPSSGTTEGGDTETVSAESDGSSGNGGSTGAPAIQCDPDPADNECFVCARVECCPEVEACADSAMCSCALECLADGWDPETCVVGCGLDGAVSNLVLCGVTQCEVPCDAAL